MTDHGGAASPRTDYFAINPLTVRRDGEHLWTDCPGCPGWSAAADSFGDLFRLASEYHADKDHGWTMIEPWLAAQEAPAPDFDSLRVQVHIASQLAESKCQPGEDHREDGPCHRIARWLKAAQEAPAPEGLLAAALFYTFQPEGGFYHGEGEQRAWLRYARTVRAYLAATPPSPAEPPRPDVPAANIVPEEPDSPMAWALRVGCGAFTVKDDSGALCTMALGSINSVAGRIQAHIDRLVRAEARPPEGPDAAWAALQQIADLAPLGPFRVVTDELAAAQKIACEALAARLSAGGATE